MTSLQDLSSQLDEFKRVFELATPETAACLDLMKDTANVLDDMRSECFLHLTATSNYVQFERLQSLVTSVRDIVYKIIEVLGDVERDFDPIAKAAELLDALGKHIRLSQNVESLEAKSLPIHEDLDALAATMKEVRTLISNFHSSVRKLFKRFEEENVR